MQDLSDSKDVVALVRQLAKGNILAFNTLFRKYSGRLYRFANGYLKSESESEELVQEVFTKIWEIRRRLKEELSFKSYLFTIAFNIIRKHFRVKANINQYFRKRIQDELDLNTTQEINYNSLHKFISELVDNLPEKRREIFIKSRFEGLSIKEISEELNISHKTVENQLSDALKYIRTHLKREQLPIATGFILHVIYFLSFCQIFHNTYISS